MATKLRIAVLASGTGTTLQAIIDACENDGLDGNVVLVVSNNSRSGAMTRARRHRIRCTHLSSRTHPEPAALDIAIRTALESSAPDVVVLAGYMKKLGPQTLGVFEGRVINTHPSLLPQFGGRGMYGGRVHRAVLDAGETVTGISVHLVDSDYDTGRVIAQREVLVDPDDDEASLAERVQLVERPFLIEVLQSIAEGQVEITR